MMVMLPEAQTLTSVAILLLSSSQPARKCPANITPVDGEEEEEVGGGRGGKRTWTTFN